LRYGCYYWNEVVPKSWTETSLWEEFHEEWIKTTVLPQKSSKDKTKDQIQTNEDKETRQ